MILIARKFTQEDYCEKVRTVCGPEYEVVSEYLGSKKPISIKHIPCGTIWTGRAGDFTLNKGKCSNRECIQKKMVATCLERYGVENYFQTEHIKRLPKAMQTVEGKEKIRATKLSKKYSDEQQLFHSSDTLEEALLKLAENLGRKPDMQDILVASGYTDSSTLYDLGLGALNNLYDYKENTHKISLGEQRLAEWLIENGFKIIQSSRPLEEHLEIDIILPDYNLGIEYNGTYWHSSIFKERDYHLKKKNYAKKIGINLLQFWDLEPEERIRQLILSKTKTSTKTRVVARKTEIRDLDSLSTEIFLNKYHIQGSDGIKGKGLFYSNILIAVMTSKKTGGEMTINRFATHDEYIIIGGFNKLVKAFIKDRQPEKVVSFADLRYVDEEDNVYQRNGWKVIKRLPPDYTYIYKGKLTHKFNLRRTKLLEILRIEDEGQTETELSSLAKINRVYDCGKLKYEM